MQKNDNFSNEFNSGQLEEQRLRIEKLKLDLVNEGKKSSTLELEEKKLKHETSDRRKFFNYVFLPMLQLGATAFLIIVTWRVGFNKNENDRKQQDAQLQQRAAQIQKFIADSETVSIKNQGLLYQIQNTAENYKLTKDSDSLLSKKLAITIENAHLQSIQNSLLVERDKLTTKIRALQNENSTADFRLSESNQELQNLMKQKDKIDEDLHFLIFNYALQLSHKRPSVYYWYSDTLIAEISKKTKFSQRIIDSLASFTFMKKGGYYGYGIYILYMGTKNETYKNGLMKSIENLIPSGDSAMRNAVDSWDIIGNYRWNKDDRMNFTKIILSQYEKVGNNPSYKAYLLSTIAMLQNNFNDINLWDNSPGLYLNYLKETKSLLVHYDTSEYVNKELSRCFAIMLPQYYLARKFTYTLDILNVFKTDVSSNYEDFSKKQKFVDHERDMALSQISYEKIDSLDFALNLPNKPKKGNFLTELKRAIISKRSTYDFWLNNDFENTPENQLLVCTKMKTISW